VSDDGPGFAEQLRTTAFDRFVTGDESRHSEGFGLGLAIAQPVVKAHNGHIQLGEGPGGIVTFSLPR
jgi:signal transduction histidine kinase